MIRIRQDGGAALGIKNQGAKILATTPDLVPTGLAEADRDRNASPVDWQTAMRRAIRSSAQLRQRLSLPPYHVPDTFNVPEASDRACSERVPEPPQGKPEPPQGKPEPPQRAVEQEHEFATFVPLELLARIRPSDPEDPILKQVMQTPAEFTEQEDFVSDPVGDLPSLAAGGLLHKYDSRALLITTGACGVHCRYCFRREFPYSSAGSRTQRWQPALDYLAAHPEIDEVLLSGGDPLTLVDGQLADLISRLDRIGHLRRLRFHSRMPVVIPQRVTDELVELLHRCRLTAWMVIHANHAQELDESVFAATDRLIERGIPVLNQAVLLRGVNDSVEALADLCRTLVDHRIQPYYLHQLDRVRGAGHFEVPVERGRELVAQLREQLPGYAVPSYVTEQAGQPSKTPLSCP